MEAQLAWLLGRFEQVLLGLDQAEREWYFCEAHAEEAHGGEVVGFGGTLGLAVEDCCREAGGPSKADRTGPQSEGA